MVPIDPQWSAEDELKWYFGRRYEGEMGLRAISLDSAGGVAPSSRCISDAQAAASERFRRVRLRLEKLDGDTRHVLALAYDPERPRGLEAYGPYSRAVLACKWARSEHDRSHSSRPLLEWLRNRASSARSAKGLEKERAERFVERAREATINMVTATLALYGTASRRPPDVVTLSQLAEVLEIDRGTVLKELTTRGLATSRHSDAHRSRHQVPLRLLWVQWPEAANALFSAKSSKSLDKS